MSSYLPPIFNCYINKLNCLKVALKPMRKTNFKSEVKNCIHLTPLFFMVTYFILSHIYFNVFILIIYFIVSHYVICDPNYYRMPKFALDCLITYLLEAKFNFSFSSPLITCSNMSQIDPIALKVLKKRWSQPRERSLSSILTLHHTFP